MEFNRQAYKKQFMELLNEKRIVKSVQSFKIKLFLEKAENSILIAKHNKELKPNKDQPKRIFWDYWAITISYYSMLYVARYSAIKAYTERRLNEIYDNAVKFVGKISLILIGGEKNGKK